MENGNQYNIRSSLVVTALVKKYAEKYSPCKEDCAERSAVCRVDCEKRKKYDAGKEEYRKEMIEKIRKEEIANAYYADKKRRLSKGR